MSTIINEAYAIEAIMKKKTIKTTKWDVVDYLKTDEDMADYLEAAREDGHPAVVATAIENIARAKGMTQVARKAGIDPGICQDS